MRSSLHWLRLSFLLLGVVLWTSIPAFATPGRAPIVADGEAHAAPGKTPAHGPGRLETGERGEVEVQEDERDSESESESGQHAHLRAVEISILALAGIRLNRQGWVERSHTVPLTGAGCIRGPPSRCL